MRTTTLMVMMVGLLAWLVLGCVSVETESGECSPAHWAAYEGEPIAAVSREFFTSDPNPADPGAAQLVAGRLGPFEGDVEIRELDVAQAPGWCPRAKSELRLATWTATELEPEGDPNEQLEAYATADAAKDELGNGFTMLRFEAGIQAARGEVLFVGVSLEDPQVCTAIALGPNEGSGWRYQPHGGWALTDGRPVVGARGCAWKER